MNPIAYRVLKLYLLASLGMVVESDNESNRTWRDVSPNATYISIPHRPGAVRGRYRRGGCRRVLIRGDLSGAVPGVGSGAEQRHIVK